MSFKGARPRDTQWVRQSRPPWLARGGAGGEGGVSADSLSSVNLHEATDGFWSFISKDTQEMKTSLSTGRTSPAGSVP